MDAGEILALLWDTGRLGGLLAVEAAVAILTAPVRFVAEAACDAGGNRGSVRTFAAAGGVASSVLGGCAACAIAHRAGTQAIFPMALLVSACAWIAPLLAFVALNVPAAAFRGAIRLGQAVREIDPCLRRLSRAIRAELAERDAVE